MGGGGGGGHEASQSPQHPLKCDTAAAEPSHDCQWVCAECAASAWGQLGHSDTSIQAGEREGEWGREGGGGKGGLWQERLSVTMATWEQPTLLFTHSERTVN